MAAKKKHGKTAFQDTWLQDPELKLWLKKVPNDIYSAGCSVCPGTVFSVSSMGRQALVSHMRGIKHQTKFKALKNSPSLGVFFKQTTLAVPVAQPQVSTAALEKQMTVPAAKVITQLNAGQSEVEIQQSTSVDSPRGLKKYVLCDNVTKAEVLWCMQCVMTHKSMNSGGKDIELLKLMFPDSEIAQKIELQRTKISYTIVFGLGKFFQLELVNILKQCEFFVVSFDESLNKVSQKQQMDIYIRFWNEENSQVETRYFNSSFLEKAKAVDLLEAFKKGLQDLQIKKMLQVSMDGPNVNFAFLKELKAHLKEEGNEKEILDLGSCGLHTVHCAFKNAMLATGWDVVKFLRSLYNLFKDVPARRGFYKLHTGSDIFPLKFCAVRWLENENIAQRAIDMLPSLKIYLRAAEEKKEIPSSSSFETVKTCVNDPMIGPKLAFFKTLSADAEPFLREFQTNLPVSPFLYEGLNDLLAKLLGRIVKPPLLAVPNLISINIEDDENLLNSKKICLGFSTQAELKKCEKITDLDIAIFRKNCKKAVKIFIAKLINRSPLKHPLVKYITCFSPNVALNINDAKTRLDRLLLSLVDQGWISGTSADKASQQYTSVCSSDITRHKLENYSKNKDRLDDLWTDILKTFHCSELVNVLRIVLTLSHGNAEVERGFSINKECVIENMKEETLIGYRTVYDAILKRGGIHRVPVTKNLLHAARNAHSLYKEHLLQKKRNGEKAEEERWKLKRKREMIKELEEKKTKMMEGARVLERQIAELTSDKK